MAILVTAADIAQLRPIIMPGLEMFSSHVEEYYKQGLVEVERTPAAETDYYLQFYKKLTEGEAQFPSLDSRGLLDPKEFEAFKREIFDKIESIKSRIQHLYMRSFRRDFVFRKETILFELSTLKSPEDVADSKKKEIETQYRETAAKVQVLVTQVVPLFQCSLSNTLHIEKTLDDLDKLKRTLKDLSIIGDTEGPDLDLKSYKAYGDCLYAIKEANAYATIATKWKIKANEAKRKGNRLDEIICREEAARCFSCARDQIEHFFSLSTKMDSRWRDFLDTYLRASSIDPTVFIEDEDLLSVAKTSLAALEETIDFVHSDEFSE